MKHAMRCIVLCLGVTPVLLGGLGAAQTPAASAAKLPVASRPLIAGSCLDVADGDLVTLDWNPGFGGASSVAGLREVVLHFASSADRALSPKVSGSLQLIAALKREGPEETFKPLDNGFYQILFHVHLRHVEPGEHRIVFAQAVPQMAEGFRGEEPKMTNSPVSSPFCLNVLPPVKGQN